MIQSMLGGLALLLLVSLPGAGAVIYGTSGPEAVQYAINTSEAIAVSWSSAVAFNNVSITVPLQSGINTTESPQEGEAFLLDSLGAGTEESDVVARTTFDFPGDTVPNQSVQTLFSGLTLNAGTYYLLLDSTSSSGGGWQSTDGSDLMITTAPGVTSEEQFYTLSSNETFAPASTFMAGLVYDPLVTVTGTVASPEPSTDALVVCSILLSCTRLRKLDLLLRLEQGRVEHL